MNLGDSHHYSKSLDDRKDCVRCPYPKTHPIHQKPKRPRIRWHLLINSRKRQWAIYK